MRTLNGKILINDKGELNEQTWLENCIAVGELLAERTRRSTTDGLIDLAVVEADRKTEPTSSKMEQVDKDINVRSKDKPQICDTCRYYNSNIPCGSTPSACKEADKFAEEFVDGLKKLKPKDEPQTERSE